MLAIVGLELGQVGAREARKLARRAARTVDGARLAVDGHLVADADVPPRGGREARVPPGAVPDLMAAVARLLLARLEQRVLVLQRL